MKHFEELSCSTLISLTSWNKGKIMKLTIHWWWLRTRSVAFVPRHVGCITCSLGQGPMAAVHGGLCQFYANVE